MIRYPISDAELRKRIEAQHSGWCASANARTARLRAKKKYLKTWDPKESKVHWGKIKPVYRKLQGHKCGYCERALAQDSPQMPDLGSAEHDVEHYRPKAGVEAWGKRKYADAPTFDFAWGSGATGGYYWLAYDLWNYCTACKFCNTTLKGNRFPIQGQPGGPSLNRSSLDAKEIPLLLFPLGQLDEDPEKHIEFGETGLPVPVRQSQRGVATIEFFLLDRRPDLEADRRRALLIAWPYFIEPELNATPAERAQREASTDEYVQRVETPHANFLRSIVRLARSKPDKALRLFEAARAEL